MTLTFPLTSAGPGPTSAALKFYIFSAEIAIPLRLMLIPVFHPGCSGGYHMERGGMQLHEAVGINCEKGATTEDQDSAFKYMG